MNQNQLFQNIFTMNLFSPKFAARPFSKHAGPCVGCAFWFDL